MPFRGHYRNGVVVLDDKPSLPEGAEVAIEVIEPLSDAQIHPEIARFAGILPANIDLRDVYYQEQMVKHE